MNISEKFDHIRRTAQAAAHRLIDARDPFLPKPQDPESFMCLVESMLRTPRKFGVLILPHERRAILTWHSLVRANNDSPQPD